MADLDELYRRVDICERLLHSLNFYPTKLLVGGYGYETPDGGMAGGASLTYESIIFFWQNEARIIHKEKEYNLNCGIIGAKYLNATGSVIQFGEPKWINISKRDLLFLDKTIIQVNEYSMSRVKDKISYHSIGTFFLEYVFSSPGLWASHEFKERLWNEMISQLIPAPPDAVESITRETINEALFETRLQIHEIKKHPPYSMGTGNPSLRMNQFMPTVSPPVSPHYSMGNPSLTPRSNQSTPPVSPRNHTRRPVPRFARRKTQNVKNNTPFIGLAPRRF